MENQIIKFAELIINVGAVFANCDGDVDPREKQFVTNFVETLLAESLIDITNKDELLSLKTDRDFNTLITQAQEFMSQCNLEEKETAISILDAFIQAVIDADGTVHEREKELYAQWKQEIK